MEQGSQGSSFLCSMVNELRRFEEENLKLETLLAQMLTTQTSVVTSYGENLASSSRFGENGDELLSLPSSLHFLLDLKSTNEKNAELQSMSQNCATSERQCVEAQALVEQEKVILEYFHKQVAFHEAHLPGSFDTLRQETEQRRQQLGAVKEEVRFATVALQEVCQEVGATRVGPVLLKDFELRIQATEILLSRLEKVSSSLNSSIYFLRSLAYFFFFSLFGFLGCR